MRFVIIYRNRPDIRANIERQVSEASKKGIDFSVVPQNTPLFKSQLFWPSISETNALPMNVQCEEVELKDNKFITHRQLVLDAEVIKVEPKVEPKVNIPEKEESKVV